jgi:hypothetical protein
VILDLKPLLKLDGLSQIAGWFPIFDTLHGVRGELNITVKLELFRCVLICVRACVRMY